MYTSTKALIERINSQFGSFVTQIFREHLFFIPEVFTTQDSQDWYVKTLIDLTRAYGFDRLVNPVLMQKLNMDTSSTIIFNPFITILNEIYTSELRADEVERLFSFCDKFMSDTESSVNSTNPETSAEKDSIDSFFNAFVSKNGTETNKNRIGSFRNLMIVSDLSFRDLGHSDPQKAQIESRIAVSSSRIKKSLARITLLLNELSTQKTIEQRNQYLTSFSEDAESKTEKTPT